MTIAEILSTKNVLSYVNNREGQQHLGQSLFPERKVDGLEFEILQAGSSIPTIANVHAFDTEAEIGSRQASRSAQELALIKRKMQLKEKDLIALRNPRTAQEEQYLTQHVYNDTFSLVEAVRARVEKMRMDVLADGIVKLGGNGLNIDVDYGVPAKHKASRQFGASTDIVGVLEEWADTLDVAPTRILTSKAVRNKILKNTGIQELFKNAGILPSNGGLNQLLEAMGLPTIVVYDNKFNRENEKGELVSERYFPEDKLVMFGDGMLGETVFGTTPEESRLISSASQVQSVGNIYAEIYESSQDPVGTFTKAVATALPSFPEANNVFQATITN
jgi:hypothetical protein